MLLLLDQKTTLQLIETALSRPNLRLRNNALCEILWTALMLRAPQRLLKTKPQSVPQSVYELQLAYLALWQPKQRAAIEARLGKLRLEQNIARLQSENFSGAFGFSITLLDP